MGFSNSGKLNDYTMVSPKATLATESVSVETFWHSTKRYPAKFNGVSVNFDTEFEESCMALEKIA